MDRAVYNIKMFLTTQRYKFESKSQPLKGLPTLFPATQRYKFESKSQHTTAKFLSSMAISNGSKIQISFPLHLLTKR